MIQKVHELISIILDMIMILPHRFKTFLYVEQFHMFQVVRESVSYTDRLTKNNNFTRFMLHIHFLIYINIKANMK